MASGKTFGELREKWREQLLGEDRNSIEQQLLRLTWDLAVFRIVQESLRFVPHDQDNRPQVNGPVLELLAGTFYKNCLVFIRRMTDASKHAISLCKILDNMQSNASLITRSAMLEAEGLSYDYEWIKEKERNWLNEQFALGHRNVNVPSEYHCWRFSEDRHLFIDRMVKTNAVKRSPDDQIPKQLFANLKSRVTSSAEPAKSHVDNYLAHSISREKRESVAADSISITFKQLKITHQVFCETASFLALAVLNESVGQWLAYPQYDQLEYLDRPFASTESLSDLSQKWEGFTEESSTWSNWDLDEYEKEFGGEIGPDQKENETGRGKDVRG